MTDGTGRFKRTGNGDPGIIRVDDTGSSGQESLEKLDWSEFFAKLEEQNLAFLYQEGESRFSKLVSRDDVASDQWA